VCTLANFTTRMLKLGITVVYSLSLWLILIELLKLLCFEEFILHTWLLSFSFPSDVIVDFNFDIGLPSIDFALSNIGNTKNELSYSEIDVVYTWVNGSDQVWSSKKSEFFKSSHQDYNMWTKNLSATTTNSNNTSSDKNYSSSGQMQTFDHNRYRDNNELRYSLRSLVANAPWIRKIYLVTDNQIPNWLNLESEKIDIITHKGNHEKYSLSF
jgi:hypothetical protein